MPRQTKVNPAPYGYKADGTPYKRKPQERFLMKHVANSETPEAIAAALKYVTVEEAPGPLNGLTGAVYEPVRYPGNAQATPSALDVQVGGNHYKTMPIQPMTFSMKNGLDACQHTIVKYVTRFRTKGGVEDLEKAKHVIDMLIEFEKNK